eukprot:TRINITY_DN5029_c0_g1_i1.p1 TRINITY_DN5029_c0_g1~~TRINITY_DN5029_c0_g1_i1.p1  ORF type:complete len:719 (-),score=131.55 TRINITY_DN5029_c0_g1_i1:14-2170(-)
MEPQTPAPSSSPATPASSSSSGVFGFSFRSSAAANQQNTGSDPLGSSSDAPPIQPSVTRNLSDKLYEKRKLGALEVEQLVKDLNTAKDEDRIRHVVQYLVTNFSDSTQGNSRKGGLIALAATAIGLGADTFKYIPQLVPPVLKCFVDQDPRVRYYACESLYNIAKVARGKILIYFNEVFDALCKLAADPDTNVKNGAQLLDRLIKDIVTESEGLNIERFIPLLQERVYVINPNCRQFLIAWVMVLNSVPDIDLLQYLPKFLDGLFNMLQDSTKDIRLETENCLSEFLQEIQKAPNVDFGSMVKILISHCASKDEFTRVTSLEWINEFIAIGKEELLPFSAQFLGAILPCLSHEVQDIKEAASKANTSLLHLITTTAKEFSINEILNTVTLQFLNQYVPTRLASLNWVSVLHSKTPNQLLSFVNELFPALLKTLSDPSDEVVRLDLEVMAKISLLDEIYFNKLMNSLVNLFSTDRHLLEHRGSLIIRQLSLFIAPEKIYVTLARILETEEDMEFASVMIQSLNLILLTAAELFEVRASLKNLSSTSESSSAVAAAAVPDRTKSRVELFTTLYRSWAHSPTATLSLCLLAQLYQHASDLIFKFGELEVTVNFLMEVDKLVQLLESPIFLYLRLQLLEPEAHPFLFKTLYGLLMILPQTKAFETLRNRLNSVSSLGVLHLIQQKRTPTAEPSLGINFGELLSHFENVQNKHNQAKKKHLAK